MGFLSGAISAGASIVGGLIGGKSAKDAAKAYEQGAKEAAKIQKEMMEILRGDLEPYRDIGDLAIEALFGKPATYKTTPEQLTTLTDQRSKLQKELEKQKKRGAGGTKGEWVWKEYKEPVYNENGKVIDVRTKKIRKYVSRYKKPQDPARIKEIERQLKDLDKQIQASQEGLGEIATPAVPGIMEQYPELEPYPDMPSYPDLEPYPDLPGPPRLGEYPTMPGMPTFDFGGKTGTQNILDIGMTHPQPLGPGQTPAPMGNILQGGGTLQDAPAGSTGAPIPGPLDSRPREPGAFEPDRLGGGPGGGGPGVVPGPAPPGAGNILQPGGPRIGFTAEDYEQSPGYQWQVDEAQKAVERMASARGYRLSPRAAQEFAKEAQGLAQQDYYTWLGSQFQKADLALRSWREGRAAAIQDWLMPWQMSVVDWQNAREATLQDWQNQRQADLQRYLGTREQLLQDWINPQQAAAANWMDKYNAWMNLLRTGQGAAGQTATGTAALGTNLADLAQSIGQMNADAKIQSGNVWANALTSGIENILQGWGTMNQPQQQQQITNPSWQWAVNMP
jgi:hypothetical protein